MALADMKKVHITLGILAEYREWCWLLSPLCREKGGLSLKEKIKQIKNKTFARSITVVEPATNEGGKKRYSTPACEPWAGMKPRTSSAAHGGSCAAEKLVIKVTSPKGMKKYVESEPVKPAALKEATTIADMIAHRKGLVVPPVSRFVLCPWCLGLC